MISYLSWKPSSCQAWCIASENVTRWKEDLRKTKKKEVKRKRNTESQEGRLSEEGSSAGGNGKNELRNSEKFKLVMDKSEKRPAKTNSSVPDIVFYQLTVDKEERVIGFVDNDSEEHFGKLARKGGEILLPAVFAQKTARLADGHPRKGKVQVRMDVPTSDTELKTLLLYGGSSAELRCLGLENGKPVDQERKSSGSDDSGFSKSEDCDCCQHEEDTILPDTSEVVLQTEQLTDVPADDSAAKTPEEMKKSKL